MSLNEIIRKVDERNSIIKNARPITDNEARQLQDFFKIENTFTSNALEGNSLTISETKVLIEDGLTVGGKPLKDVYETVGHADAYEYMLKIAKEQNLKITEADILSIHKLFYERVDPLLAGKYREDQVYISGTDHLPPAAEDISELMGEYVDEINKRFVSDEHPVLLASYAHRRLVDIHPFIDGNGRTARLVMNLILINKGYLPVSIPPVYRSEYIGYLEQARADRKDNGTAFDEFIGSIEYEVQKDYIRMLRIEEAD